MQDTNGPNEQGSYYFVAHEGSGGNGRSRKNSCHKRGDQKFLLYCFKKKMGMGTFDAAIRTALHFSQS